METLSLSLLRNLEAKEAVATITLSYTEIRTLLKDSLLDSGTMGSLKQTLFEALMDQGLDTLLNICVNSLEEYGLRSASAQYVRVSFSDTDTTVTISLEGGPGESIPPGK